MEYIVRTKNISKKYKKQYALDKFTMNIQRGDIYGFVGENGSGKTTIIRIITGLVYPTKGSFELFGKRNNNKDIKSVRSKIGAIVESPSIYLNFNAKDNLKMQCSILGVKPTDELIKETLETVGLGDVYKSKKKASNFSLGMRQRLGIAMVLLGNPELIILDEPMNGLDPSGIVEIRELILKLNKEKNITFLISSHILSELSLVATKYGIISKGKMLKEISAEDLQEEFTKSLMLETFDIYKAYDVLKIEVNPNKLKIEDGKLYINDYSDINHILGIMMKNNIEITNFNVIETNIENYYLSLIGGHHA